MGIPREQWRRLAAAIRAAEGGPPADPERLATGWEAVDARLGGGLACGALHEWRAEAAPIGVLLHLAARAQQARGGGVVWIGRSCWPHPPVLERFGAGLLRQSLFVDPPDPDGRAWAGDEALRSGPAAVVVETAGLRSAAHRRLQLAAEAEGGLALLALADAEGSDGAAVAATRWRVTPRPGPRPRWRLEWLRGRGPNAGEAASGAAWELEWRDAQGDLVLVADGGDRPAPAAVAAADPARGPRDAGGAGGGLL